MTPAHKRKTWIQISVLLGFSILLLTAGLAMRAVGIHKLATPGAFLCLGGLSGIFLFGAKAVQFIIYLRNNNL